MPRNTSPSPYCPAPVLKKRCRLAADCDDGHGGFECLPALAPIDGQAVQVQKPVKEATRRVYMEKFGIRILEGYGITETSPALALNTPMFNRLTEDMDINCGVIVDGKSSIQEVGEKFFQIILRTASGEPSKSEAMGYGEDEFAPWVLGPTM